MKMEAVETARIASNRASGSVARAEVDSLFGSWVNEGGSS
jgi:hypothetical protein